MEKCIFCEIAAGRIPAAKVYEDDKFVAFLDINPLNQGHTQVVPKEHARWTYEVPNFGEYFEVAKSIALSSIDALGAKFVNMITAGTGVPHAHIHVIPRFEDDGHGDVPNWGNVKKFSQEEIAETAQKLSAAMQNHPPKKMPIASAPNPQTPTETEPAGQDPRAKEQIEHIKREMQVG